ncbi:MAG: peptidoglycan DD-metalloendopeptidase family protein [Deltaproteobacteria bacterium]|nr:peptidoglycan DD-metalloendopeptidase family protein [Deltaproteobacteria bacterium]
MAKKPYTVLIVSQKAAIVKRFILSPLVLKIAACVLGIVLLVSAFILYDYGVYKKKLSELQALRSETKAQRAEIQSFVEKISALEEQLAKLKEMEEQMEKDLKDIQELKKTKKGPSPVPKKNISFPIKEWAAYQRLFPLNAEVSVLESERPRLVRQLHQDLTDLRQEAFLRGQVFKELKGYLRAQKSILAAMPSLWPVYGRISSHFGDTRLAESSGGTRPHNGLDITASVGTPVLAPADGVVISAGNESFYGYLISLDHGHGFVTLFGHLKSMKVKPGEKVSKGQVIGTVGLTGKTTGAHLHYEIRIFGQPVNPFRYLNEIS